MNCDPHDKFPKDGLMLVVSEDMDHLGALWKKMAQPGEFKKIRDEKTKLWRAVRFDPDNPLRLDPYDDAYREKWEDAPPLLPERAYQTPSWENASREIPRYVKSRINGWRILFRSSEGRPQKGEHYNAVWFDEQLANEQFYIEARRGAVALAEDPRHIPRMWWSATPQNANPQLQELAEVAATGGRNVEAFQFLVWENPYIPDDEKQAFYESIPEDERISRWEGNFALQGRRIYPSYQPQGIHGCEPFEIPPDWARYFVVDPGTRFCATLFLAVDPDEQHIWVYDEEVINQSNTVKWAAAVKRRDRDHAWEAAVIDQKAGSQHQMGISNKNTAEEYFLALREAGVQIRSLGSMGGFYPGNKDVEARQMAVNRWLAIRGTGPFSGTPTLQVMRGCCPKLDQEIKRAHIDVKTGKRSTKIPQDAVTTLEYAASFQPGYHEPQIPSRVLGLEKIDTYKAMIEGYHSRRRDRRRKSVSRYGAELEIG